MALVAIYVENKEIHTYNGTDHLVHTLGDQHDTLGAKPLISSDTTYADLHAWAVASADTILQVATELAVYLTNVDTSIVLEDVADYKGYLNFHSDTLLNLIFGALNKKVADGDVVGFTGTVDGIRHHCEQDGEVSMHPRIIPREGFTGQIALNKCEHRPEAAQHLPYALYKHFTMPY